ncbi:MAG: hypothetical protein PHW28_06780 [Mesotoga sp.]|nr:hypothetical protein [Mesotoga sp.]
MKRNKYVHKCGPFKVVSVSQSCSGIQMVVYPAFPKYNLSEKEQTNNDIDKSWRNDSRWAIHRLKLHEGGGPSIFSCIALAEELENFLNQQYTSKEITEWKATLEEALSDYNKKQTKAFERAMKRQQLK